MDRVIYVSNDTLRLVEYRQCDDYVVYEDWLDPDTERGYNFVLKESFEEFSNRTVRQRFLAMIQLNSTKEIIGAVGISPLETVPDLAIWVFRPYRRQGYGVSAFTLATRYALKGPYLAALLLHYQRQYCLQTRQLFIIP